MAIEWGWRILLYVDVNAPATVGGRYNGGFNRDSTPD
jgi:hypothetical protein